MKRPGRVRATERETTARSHAETSLFGEGGRNPRKQENGSFPGKAGQLTEHKKHYRTLLGRLVLVFEGLFGPCSGS